jgi:3-methyladenine DNA glycosylase Tag
VVRSKARIEATIDNAQALLELDAEYGGFARYLVSHGGSKRRSQTSSGSSASSATAALI